MTTNCISERVQLLQKTLGFFQDKFPAGYRIYLRPGVAYPMAKTRTNAVLTLALAPVSDTLIHKWVRPALDATGIGADISRACNDDYEIVCNLGPDPVISLAYHLIQACKDPPYGTRLTVGRAFCIIAGLIEPIRLLCGANPGSLDLSVINPLSKEKNIPSVSTLVEVLLQAITATYKNTPPKHEKYPTFKEIELIADSSTAYFADYFK